ncbi:MAG: tripartite tricarboxylate transporter TctB family protein [Jannaschia sp.]
MADRAFAAFLLAVTLGYGWIAFFAISAPFQYDPLGPETWPQILAVVMAACLLVIVAKPDMAGFDTDRGTLVRLAVTVALLLVYAETFEPLGFVLSTAGFCIVLARMLGATMVRSTVFGLVAGVAGYLVAAGLLDLNLPAGPFPRI